MAAPILWATRISVFFLQENLHVHKIRRFRGGGILGLGGGRGKCRFYFYGRGEFSEKKKRKHQHETPHTARAIRPPFVSLGFPGF